MKIIRPIFEIKPKTRKLSKESTMIPDMSDFKVIERIVNDYGKVMERMAWATFGAPESILPYPKEIIKSAILEWLKIEKDELSKKDLKAGYRHLALFIQDEQARICIAAQMAIESGDPFHPNFDLLKKSNAIQNEIATDMAKLINEIGEL